jgi:NAD(P)-dependent dehydrogenase (short-subunit alcohol dehydrogenase family)
MDRLLEGKTAIVTGGSRGIGRAIAEALLRSGAAVAICGRSEEGVRKAVEEMREQTGGRVVGLAADVGRPEQVETFFRFVDERLGGLDILVNNAGIGTFPRWLTWTSRSGGRPSRPILAGCFIAAGKACLGFASGAAAL